MKMNSPKTTSRMRIKTRIVLLILYFSFMLSTCGQCTGDESDGPDIPITRRVSSRKPRNLGSTTSIASTDLSRDTTIINGRVQCESDEDCAKSINATSDDDLGWLVCDHTYKICILNIPEGLTTTTSGSGETKSITTPNATPIITTKQPPDPNQEDDTGRKEGDIHDIPVVVWLLFTLPFISIIIVGLLCGRRLKSQAQVIENNLLHTTIDGVRVEGLIAQRDIIQTIAALSPPPTYEKATGEVPPSYETFLQLFRERRLSIFQCNSLMAAAIGSVKANSGGDSTCSTCNSATIESAAERPPTLDQLNQTFEDNSEMTLRNDSARLE